MISDTGPRSQATTKQRKQFDNEVKIAAAKPP